jgi:ATP-dependent RNA helicase SUPV3L1/SUV3
MKGLEEVPYLAASGRTSFKADPEVNKGLYRAAGFKVCGERAVRVDILERLADLVRPAIAYRPGQTPGAPPPGTADNNGFVVTVGMTSLAGCSGEDFASILRALGYVVDRRPGPPITVPLLPVAAVEPLKPVPVSAPADGVDEGTAEPSGPDHETVAADEAAREPGAAGDHAGDEPDDVVAAPVEEPIETPPPPYDTQTPPELLHAADPAPDAPADSLASPAIEHTIETPVQPDDAAVSTDIADGAGVPPDEPAPAATTDTTAEAAASVESSPPEATQTDAPVAAPAEPVLIEVWRPHRHHHHAERRPERPRGGRPQGRHGGQGERRPVPGGEAPPADPAAAATAEGAAVTDRTGERPRHDQRPRPDHRQNRPDQARGNRPGREDRPRPPSGEGRGPSQGEGGRPSRGAPVGDHRRDRHAGGGERRNERSENRNAGPFASTEAPRPSRERQPDPDSPFAKLLALKAELEGRSKKD